MHQVTRDPGFDNKQAQEIHTRICFNWNICTRIVISSQRPATLEYPQQISGRGYFQQLLQVRLLSYVLEESDRSDDIVEPMKSTRSLIYIATLPFLTS